MTLLTHCFFWPRVFVSWGSCAVAAVMTLMTKCCLKPGKRPAGIVAGINL